MRIPDKARLRLRSLFRRPHVDCELEAELRFHLDQLIAEKISSGMPPEDARRAAQRMIGGVVQYKEECRDMRRVNFVEDLVQDVRYTIRSPRVEGSQQLSSPHWRSGLERTLPSLRSCMECCCGHSTIQNPIS